MSKNYTISRLVFIGPRDQVYYQYSAHPSSKRPRLSEKAKRPVYRFIKSVAVYCTDSKTEVMSVFFDLFDEHRFDRLCLNISRKCNLRCQTIEPQQATLDNIRHKYGIMSDSCRKGAAKHAELIKDSPWRKSPVISRPHQVIAWAHADEVYDYWVATGKGCKLIERHFSEKWGVKVNLNSMIYTWFRDRGWNPHECLEWQLYHR